MLRSNCRAAGARHVVEPLDQGTIGCVMQLPAPRGPLGQLVLGALQRPARPGLIPDIQPTLTGPAHLNEDIQLTLWVCFELSYRGFAGVDADWEWEPSLVGLRRRLERLLVDELNASIGAVDNVAATEVAAELTRRTTGETRSVARFIHRGASVDQLRELLIHRSVYHLKEADPHSWAIPRLGPHAKAALLEIQFDEYGGVDGAGRMHSQLFARTMRAAGLVDRYGHYLDVVPAVTLAISNVMSLFGLNNRWQGALVGHLAAFEMTSSLPNRRYAQGLRRLGFDDGACQFFDEHVEADAVHEQLALHDLCGALLAERPELAGDVVFGAASAVLADSWWSDYLLDRWDVGAGTLLAPVLGPILAER